MLFARTEPRAGRIPPVRTTLSGLWIWLVTALVAASFSGCVGVPAAPEPPPHLRAGKAEAVQAADRYRQGCYARARELFLTALKKFSAADRIADVAATCNNLGITYRALGDPETAGAFFGEAQALFAGQGNRDGEVQALCNRSAALMDLGRLDEAAAALDRAAAKSAAAPKPLSCVLKNRGVLLMKTGDLRKAEAFLRSALESLDAGETASQGATRSAMGALMEKTGRPEEAGRFYRQALEADRRAGFYPGMADDLAALATLAGDPAEAAALYKRSVRIYALLGNREQTERVMADLEAAAQKGNVDIALTRQLVLSWLEDDSGWAPCR